MRPHDERHGEKPSGDAQPVEHSEQGDVDHAHPGQTEQEAHIVGEHGWSYGGEPQDKTPAAPIESTESTSDADPGAIAPPDLNGHHPDWRR